MLLRPLAILALLLGSPLPAPPAGLPAQAGAKAAHPYPPSPRETTVWFADVARAAGLAMANVNGGVDTKKYIIETTGSGVAILDYDRDGWPDIFLVNGSSLEPAARAAAPSSHLYHNNHDGTFTDVTARAGLLFSGWGQGACVGDYDNDGYDDLFVTYYGHNRLYHNERDGTFRPVAEAAGVAGNGRDWGTGCAFVDYDRDGRLDLMVANYVDFDVTRAPRPGEGLMCLWKGAPVMCGPRGLPYTHNLLYHNLGGGRFADASASSGIEKTYGHYGFSVSTLDYDDDGWPDIYVACDSTPSILYHNNQDGTFTDQAAFASVAFDEDGREQAGMGSAIGDYDGDGRPDIAKTNFSDDTSSLYRNNGDGTFTPSIYSSGLSLNTHYLGWGIAFLDADNRGQLDLLLVNGHVYPEVDTARLGSTYREPSVYYRNLGQGRFADRSAVSGPALAEPISGRGLALADLWNDGRLSAVVNVMSGTPRLFVNLAENGNHWLGVALEGRRSNRDGIGARVTVISAGKRSVAEVRSGSSYLSSSDLRLHFGLGGADKVEGVEVRWPGGWSERFAVAGVDRIVTLVEGEGSPLPAASPGAAGQALPR